MRHCFVVKILLVVFSVSGHAFKPRNERVLVTDCGNFLTRRNLSLPKILYQFTDFKIIFKLMLKILLVVFSSLLRAKF